MAKIIEKGYGDDRAEIQAAVQKEREEIAEIVKIAGQKCGEGSQGCGCYMTFTRLVQVILARK